MSGRKSLNDSLISAGNLKGMVGKGVGEAGNRKLTGVSERVGGNISMGGYERGGRDRTLRSSGVLAVINIVRW